MPIPRLHIVHIGILPMIEGLHEADAAFFPLLSFAKLRAPAYIEYLYERKHTTPYNWWVFFSLVQNSTCARYLAEALLYGGTTSYVYKSQESILRDAQALLMRPYERERGGKHQEEEGRNG